MVRKLKIALWIIVVGAILCIVFPPLWSVVGSIYGGVVWLVGSVIKLGIFIAVLLLLFLVGVILYAILKDKKPGPPN